MINLINMIKNKLNGKTWQYIEAIIYILLIILASVANIYGSIYIKMIPMLFIVGILGKIIFGKPVTTTLFGFIVSVCVLHLKYRPGIFENTFISSCIAFQIALGEIFGEYILRLKELYKANKKRKNKKYKKIVIQYLILTLTFFIFVFSHNYINGNIFEYNACKETLSKYLANTYPASQRLKIVEGKYNILKSPNYTFNVRGNSGNNINKFVIYLSNKDIVNDGYKEGILAKNSSEVSAEFFNFLSKNELNEKYIGLDLSMQYIEVGKIQLKVVKEVEKINEDVQEKFCQNLADLLTDLKSFAKYDEIDEILLNLDCYNNKKDSSITNVYMKGYNQNLATKEFEPYEYLMNALSIEYFD